MGVGISVIASSLISLIAGPGGSNLTVCLSNILAVFECISAWNQR